MTQSISAISITEAAAVRMRALLAAAPQPAAALRLSVRPRGCSGLSYDLAFAAERTPADDVVEDKGITLLIDQSALMFLIGTEMDYVEDQMRAGFVFRNPNEKGRCGCGESFNV